ncbi:MAG: bifunctional hydroxymethylpyrimidine kinase/phosphomethylpyrimidine kinase [Deltaproteobacteria bacterium]|nr:bifunctional hydroxymethylpyrimidine kinase/phosphomethylpyrimidine kinase [Deltaproteobacteria bacterium]
MHQRSAHRSLLVIGSVALDDIDGPFGLHKDLLGGSASFIARVASYFTSKVSVVAVVGDDFPKHHVDELTALGVDTSGIERQPGETFHWVGKYAPDLSTRETIDTRLGVFADFAPKVSEAQKDAQLVILGNIDPALQLDVLRQVRAPALVAMDTMNLWINIKRDDLAKTLAKVQTLMINDEEARLLAEEHNLRRAAAKILKMGPTSVIIKRGDAGALLFHGGGVFAAPAMPLADVKDPTGAGDSFAGGLMGYLAYAGDLSPATIRTAMIMGSVMGSFAVEQFSVDGLRDLTTAKIQQRFDELAELAHFERVRL